MLTHLGVINIISEHFIEAANATSINAPYGISEWALSGLTPAPCKHVKASRVKESIFSIEGKLMETKEFESRANPGTKTGVLAIIEGIHFWVREDAINEDKNLIDPAVKIGHEQFLVSADGTNIDLETYESIGWNHLRSNY
jgi:flavin reductase (DIM6/NTAB) family NADH-FMN oxidoreductase RutF